MQRIIVVVVVLRLPNIVTTLKNFTTAAQFWTDGNPLFEDVMIIRKCRSKFVSDTIDEGTSTGSVAQFVMSVMYCSQGFGNQRRSCSWENRMLLLDWRLHEGYRYLDAELTLTRTYWLLTSIKVLLSIFKPLTSESVGIVVERQIGGDKARVLKARIPVTTNCSSALTLLRASMTSPLRELWRLEFMNGCCLAHKISRTQNESRSRVHKHKECDVMPCIFFLKKQLHSFAAGCSIAVYGK